MNEANGQAEYVGASAGTCAVASGSCAADAPAALLARADFGAGAVEFASVSALASAPAPAPTSAPAPVAAPVPEVSAALLGGAALPVDSRLRCFFEPQVEQLGMHSVECCGGVVAGGANHLGEGNLWALQLSESCLVVSHEVVLASEFSLEEEAPASLCVASISQAGVSLCPIGAAPAQLRREENVTVFEQGGRTVNNLHPSDSFNSVAACVLPSYFDDMRAHYGDAVARRAYGLMTAPGGVVFGGSEPYVRAALRSVGSVRSGSAATRRMLAKKVEGIIALLAVEDYEASRAFELRGCRDNARIAAQARCLIEADPAHAPTIDQLSGLLGVSRARLCAIFKQETGESIGSFAARKRIDLACSLLEDARLSVAQVAQAAGYEHQSSFTDAFSRATGKTPRQWRNNLR